jgi:SAM-dependent MidA family methyltransferase|tara:strand:+ start:11874 stop:12965 length:1092 start_codon:yes stop_codon:yes gene_type:complete
LISSAGGVLPFDDYMEAALYAPGLGYYAAGARKFGEDGDFVTAPEMGDLFGRCLAREAEQILTAIPNAAVLEFGAGSGALARTLITSLGERGQLPSQYNIVEVSPDLRQRQHERLAPLCQQYGVTLRWLEALPQSPFNGLVLANEVVDAFPVTRFRVEGGQVRRAGVRLDGDEFVWNWMDDLSEDGAEAQVAQRFQLADSYITEVCPRAQAWIRALASCLNQGVVLIVDYGFPRAEYYLPQRAQGALRCHYRHRAHDNPFLYPGLQDITCHVDFSALADAGHEAGLELLGYTSQEAYLLSLGLMELAVPREDDDEQAILARSKEIKQLVLPSQMGEACKVMALGKGLTRPLDGFSLRDRSASL